MIWNIVSANKEVKKLTEELTQLKADNANLLKSVEDFKQKEAAFGLGSQEWAEEKQNLIKGNEEGIKALEEKHKKEVEDLTKQLTEAKESSAKKAADIVASIGLSPETVKVTTSDVVGKSEAKSRFTITTFTTK